MDSMNYNFFTAAAHQPYQYLGFGADAGLLPGVSGDVPGSTPVSSGPLSCART